MSSEEFTKAVGYLRSTGGYFLTVTPLMDSVVVVGSFKDVGSYSSTLSYAATGQDFEEVQANCVIGLAKLVKYTEGSKPAGKPAGEKKAAYAAPTGGAIVSLKGLSDKYWGKAKDAVKEAGFRFDKESKDWIGGDVSKLPEWLQKRTKGGVAKAAAKPNFDEPPASSDDDMDVDFGQDDQLPF